MKKLYSIILLAFVCAIVGLHPFGANAQYVKLLDFNGTNGGHPLGSLITDGTFLYGMTYQGGINGDGCVFKIKPDGTGYSKLYDFTNDSINGINPYGSLISDGVFFYGMTYGGGTYGVGTIFKIKPDGTGYAKLLDFSGTANGANALGSLITDGTFLYGMTSKGGTNDMGVIFKIKPDGTGYSKLHDYIGYPTDGSNPYGDLFFDGTFFYGMTIGGVANNYYGTIFKIKLDGSGYAKLLDFAGATNGEGPTGSFISDGTFLYGMTSNGGTSTNCNGGCGVIFKIKPDGTGYSKLYDFTGSPTDGANPSGNLFSDGTFFYGVDQADMSNGGNLFKIKPDGTGFTKLHDFGLYSNGNDPIGSLVSDGTSLYGMTEYGGSTCLSGCGTIYKYHPAGMGIVENNAETDFSIYPNPNNGTFTITTQEKEYEIIISNLIGECIYRQISKSTNQQIDLSEAKSGIYFLNIKTENGIANKKLIINK